MSENRVLLLEGQLRVARDTGRIAIENGDSAPRFIAPQDIAVLIVDSPAVLISSAALRLLADSGCVVMLTDSRHMPLAHFMPTAAETRCVQRLHLQIAMNSDSRRHRLWGEIVAARIRSQAEVLRALGRNGSLYLERLALKVQPGDVSNHEAQAAKHYWKNLWDGKFTREKRGAEDLINASLNYGYAVVRSLIARSLASAGLNLALGIAHDSEKNPFNLVDDFIEPYRFVVEQHVAEFLEENPGTEFEPATRASIAACIQREVGIDNEVFRLPAAIDATTASFCRNLELATGAETLRLPARLAG